MSEKTLVSAFEMKAIDEAARTFSGLASTWELDLGGDVIEQGAFKRTLKNWKKSKKVLPLLDSHGGYSTVRSAVGKLLDAEENEDGLETEFQVIDGPDGDEIFRRVKGGYVDGLSIGYQAVKVRYPETEEERASGVYRYLSEVKLLEVSVVLWPMNPGARIDTSTAKALILASKNHELDEDDRAELKRLGEEIDELLGAPTDGGPPPEPSAEQIRSLEAKLRALNLHRLATRLRSARHSAGLTLERFDRTFAGRQ